MGRLPLIKLKENVMIFTLFRPAINFVSVISMQSRNLVLIEICVTAPVIMIRTNNNSNCPKIQTYYDFPSSKFIS